MTLLAARGISDGRATAIAALVACCVFVAVFYTSATTLAPAGDGSFGWLTTRPHRTVLCIRPRVGDSPWLVLAARPDEAAEAAVHARLITTEIVQGSKRWGIVHRDHVFGASLVLAGFEIPWMINEYTSALPDLPGMLLFRWTADADVARVAVVLIGAMTVFFAAIHAGRVGGAVGASVAGLFLATEPSFIGWKRALAAPEATLQVLAVACLALAGRSVRDGSVRMSLLCGLVVGFGSHVKLSFAAPALAILLGAAAGCAIRPRLRPKTLLRVLPALALGCALGFAPTGLFWMADPGGPHLSLKDGRADLARKMLQRAGPPVADHALTEPKRRGSPVVSALQPLRQWTQWWSQRGAGFEPGARPLDPIESLRFGLVFAMALAAWGTVRLFRDPSAVERARLALITLASCVFAAVLIPLMNSEVHHCATWLPLLAVVLGQGVGASSLASRRVLGVAPGYLVAVVLAVSGILQVRNFDRELDRRAFGLSDSRNLDALATALLAAGDTAPAVFERDLMSLLDASSGGKLSPFLYGYAQGRRAECLMTGSPPWLTEVLRAHRGGVVVATYRMRGDPLRGSSPGWLDDHDLVSAAEKADLRVDLERELGDPAGRTFAKLYRVSPRAPANPSAGAP